jgi:hypothetical protein
MVESPGIPGFSLVQKLDVHVPCSLKSAKRTDATGDSVTVLFVIEKSGYIYTERPKVLFTEINNVNHFTLVEEGQKSSASIDSTGGVLTVANIRGDLSFQ